MQMPWPWGSRSRSQDVPAAQPPAPFTQGLPMPLQLPAVGGQVLPVGGAQVLASVPESLPASPELPDVPEVPELPELPEVPELPELPDVPDEPSPEVPEVPDVLDVPESGSVGLLDDPGVLVEDEQ